MRTTATSTLVSLLLCLPLACKSEGQTTDAAKPVAAKPAAPAKAEPAKKPEEKPEKKAEVAAAETAAVGAKAPDFTLADLDGKEHKLSDYAGKTVVLEWFNPGCPFVKYAHGKGPLKDMGNKYTKEGLVWLAVNSGAPGKQGHGVETNKKAADEWKMEYPVLVDENGAVGKAYGAQKTPHMYVIAEDGTLLYRGAIDNAPMGETEEGDAVNYVAECLTAKADGKPIAKAETKPYGCSVKYAKT